MTSTFRSAASSILALLVIATVLAVLLFSRPSPVPSEVGPPAVGAKPSTSALPTAPTSDGRASAKQAMVDMGYLCFSEISISRGKPAAATLAALDEKAQNAGGANTWLDNTKGPWAPGQKRIGGTATEVAAAYGGKLYDENWVLAERDGAPFAFRIQPVTLPSGLVVWIVSNTIQPTTPCDVNAD